MLSNIQILIMANAVKIRLQDPSANIDDILNSYPKLTDEDKKKIKDRLKK